MAMLFAAGAAYGRSLITSGNVNTEAAWSFTAVDGNALLGANGDDWVNYGRHHLGADAAAGAFDTKAHWKYPFAKGGTLYRSALTAIRSRAAQQNDTTIFDAAGTMIEMCDANAKGARPVSTRAYSVLSIKSINEDQRIITGIATTPTPDHVGDIVEPQGASFKLPLPLLWQHDARQPIGHVTQARVTPDGIGIIAELVKVADPGPLQARLDEAWQSIKSGLVRGLSIGFKELEFERIEDTYSYRIMKWMWLELSAVTIPMNEEASIASIKSIDASLLAASGRIQLGVVRLSPAGVSAPRQAKTPKEGTMAKTISEQIAALEAKRAANIARMETISSKSIDEGRSMDESERQDFDAADGENDAIDADLVRLKKLERAQAVKATPVRSIDVPAALTPTPSVSVRAPPKLGPGIAWTQMIKSQMSARLVGEPPLVMAQRMYGHDSECVALVTKANEVFAGTTLTGNWAAKLVAAEGGPIAEFLEFLRPQTIVGRFGTNGIPPLQTIDFYRAVVTQTGGGDAYWVGEGKPKPLTSFNFDRTTLTPLKIANIAVLTEENIRYSSPNSDVIVRNALAAAIIEGIDTAFIAPANNGSSNVKPASITYGAETVAAQSTGDIDDVILDIRALFQKFIDADNPPTEGVWIMSTSNALALNLMLNPLGQRAFPNITMNGGTLEGLPVIPSRSASSYVTLVNASQILLGDEGGVAVDMSRDASLEMRSSGIAQDATAGTATTGSVSMFATNSVALRAERTINWKLARASAVAYLTGVEWGGHVPPS